MGELFRGMHFPEPSKKNSIQRCRIRDARIAQEGPLCWILREPLQDSLRWVHLALC